MSRTPTLPPTDSGMWRRMIARTHPDAGGDHELFIWAGSVREFVCNGGAAESRPEPQDHRSRRREASTPGTERVPFDWCADFEVLSDRAIAMASAVAEPYGYLLRRLSDCYPVADGPLCDQQRRGASYKSLAAIGHTVGMTKAERVQWYRIAETIPLSQRHAGHILSQLKREAA
jgi:hypothetical protein